MTKSTGRTALEIIDELAAVYKEVYTEPPYDSGPLFDLDAFRSRTEHQAGRAGFTIVTTRSAERRLIGFSFGYPFAAGRWWAGETTQPPDQIKSVPKFAVIELVLLRPWRGRGIGHQQINELLADRPEPYATLCSLPEAPVRRLYEQWGWLQFGQSHLPAQALTLDVLVLPLTALT